MEASLFDFIQVTSVEYDEQLLHIMAFSVARSMDYLHSCNLIHRDLKSLNLLVNQHFEIKICDFGLSRVIDRNQPMTANIGTVCWVAPEIFSNKKLYTEKADVYSYGVILWELLVRKMPFEDEEAFTIPLLVAKGKRPKMPKEVPKGWDKLIKNCWHQKPAKRPSFSEIMTILEQGYAALCTKRADYADEIAFKLSKKGDVFALEKLTGEDARAQAYPVHAVWKLGSFAAAATVTSKKPKK